MLILIETAAVFRHRSCFPTVRIHFQLMVVLSCCLASATLRLRCATIAAVTECAALYCGLYAKTHAVCILQIAIVQKEKQNLEG